MVPSASVPPSSGTPGIWRRKSSIGAVDAQGLGLTHPMTWIDERLFGWSRSAQRGTSAWGGFSGDEASRVGTPDDTDDEDTGDYDAVVGLLPATDGQLHSGQKASRQSSFADLQRLRSPHPQRSEFLKITPFTTPAKDATDTEEGLQFRQGHRTRRESLSDCVPVTRIAAMDQAKTFPDATHKLNDEIGREKDRTD